MIHNVKFGDGPSSFYTMHGRHEGPKKLNGRDIYMTSYTATSG